MAKDKICGIYCIENLTNGKKYIGQSVDIDGRWREHKSELKRNKHRNEKIQNAWNKYGETQFQFSIIELCDKGDLDALEKFYINFYDSYKNGYNKDLGGSQFRDCSESMIYNMRYAQKSRPIYQIDFDGKIVAEWYGAREASKKLQITQEGIFLCLHHIRLTYKKYIWIFVDEFNVDTFDINKYINKPGQAKAVVQKSLDGNVIKTWTSTYQTQFDGFNPSSVWACCTGKQKSHKKFLWEYM